MKKTLLKFFTVYGWIGNFILNIIYCRDGGFVDWRSRIEQIRHPLTKEQKLSSSCLYFTWLIFIIPSILLCVSMAKYGEKFCISVLIFLCIIYLYLLPKFFDWLFKEDEGFIRGRRRR